MFFKINSPSCKRYHSWQGKRKETNSLQLKKFKRNHQKETEPGYKRYSNLNQQLKNTYYSVSVLFLQISPETPLITAFHMFAEKRVSALPVVDDNGNKYFFVCLLTSLFAIITVFFGEKNDIPYVKKINN